MKRKVASYKEESYSLKLAVNDLVANTWNFNQMSKDDYGKLKVFIDECLKTTGSIPDQVVVRCKSVDPARYEIIDGYHRWKAIKELGYKDIDVWVYDCDDRTARYLTNSLNYLRGQPDSKREIDYIKELITEGATLDDIVQHTSYTKEDLDDKILLYGIDIEEVTSLSEKTMEEEKIPEAWVELKFSVPVDVAELVEMEIKRISTTIAGKNLRGRALEFMCANSALTPLESIGAKTMLKKKKKPSHV